ncbi:MAG: thiamine phosphate synthase [Planctomycetes bacterium]|nr:thiamine phosphate synthase [Planctomycetota bacterium]
MTISASALRRVLVTQRALLGERPLAPTILDAARRGAATAILLREKDLDDGVLFELARALVVHATVPVVLAHRPDLARDAGCAGVHLGWNSPSIQEARKFLEPGAVVGVSVHDVNEGVVSTAEGADYLFCGPVRPTPKAHGPVEPIGFSPLRELAARTSVPVVGIGGLTPADEEEVMATGAAGFAAIRAFVEYLER